MAPPAILRPAAAVLHLGLRAQRGARRRVESGAGELAERAVAAVLRGRLVEAFAEDLVRYRVIERVSEPVLAAGTVERVLTHADAAGLPQRVAERLLADGIAEQVAMRLLAGPELERIVATALESPGFSRMLEQVVESRAVDQTVSRVIEETAQRLPQSEAMWQLVDIIAASPAVTEAIAQQSVGFADHVAGAVAERSRHADAKLERAAWSLLRRRNRDQTVEGAPSTPGVT
jgi:hypothetical protein